MVQSLWKQSCRKNLSHSSNLPLKPKTLSRYGTVQTASDVILQLATAWRGTDCAQMGIACNITLASKSYAQPACLQERQWMHAPLKPSSVWLPCLSTQAALHGGGLSKLQGCSSTAEVSELKQTSPHTSMLSKPPARAWGRDQHTSVCWQFPALFCCIMWSQGPNDGGWAARLHTGVSAGEFRKVSVSRGLHQGAGQLEKVFEQRHSNQNSCAPEDVKSSYNHLWNQRLTSFLSGKSLSADGGGKQGTEPD